MKGQESNSSRRGRRVSRRRFLQAGAVAAAGFTIVPRNVLAGTGHTPPSEKLNIAFIGVGGQGERNIAQLQNENVVALCDVDEKHAERASRRSW
jgi:hypothetical protein